MTDDNLDCDDASVAFTSSQTGDCNDGLASVNPGAAEVGCDSIDNDCNAGTPDILDGDSDTYACDVDCNDALASINPGAAEVVGDGTDQDCDGVDDCYQDLDSDGWGSTVVVTDDNLDCDDASVAFTSSQTGDCNDGLASVNPGAAEVVGDGTDQDCDGVDDCYQDLDSDGWGSTVVVTDDNLDCDDASVPFTSSQTGDCNDGLASVNPGAAEVVGDGADQDCDGVDDCYQDLDSDGWGSAVVVTDDNLDCDDASVAFTSSQTGDCNDGLASVNPGAAEVVGDGADQDCDGVDDCYQDLDSDGWGSAVVVTDDNLDCDDASVAFTSSQTGDCNDGLASVNPGAAEVGCDSIDNDCNAGTPDILDGDSDTYACDVDCNDALASINPGAAEVVGDGTDQDCDGVDDCYQDLDSDGWGSTVVVTDDNLDCRSRLQCCPNRRCPDPDNSHQHRRSLDPCRRRRPRPLQD